MVNLLAVILAVYGFSGEKRADSNLPTHTLELLHKRSDLLKHRLLLGEVLRVQRAHLGQHSIQFRSLRLRWLRGLTNQA